jgi:hypothetical protein
VRLNPFGDVAAAVSEVDSETLAEADAERHLDVLLDLLRSGAVLPVQFGMAAPDEDSLAAQLGEWEPALAKELARFADVVEVDLTVVDDERAAVAAVLAGQPALNGLVARTPADRLALGEQLAALVLDRRARLADELLALLREAAVEDAPRALLQSAEDPVLRWAFLVARDGLAEFDAAVNKVNELHPELQFSSVGPLPPFSFVSLNMAVEQRAAPTMDDSDPFRSGKWGW